MSLENFSQEHELSPEAEFAPYVIRTDDPELLSKEELEALDALLMEDAPELYISEEEEGSGDGVETQESERVSTAEETVMARQVEELRKEADTILAETSEADREKVTEKLNTVIRALIVGGIGLFGASNEASARDFDIGRVLGQEVSRSINDLAQEQRQVEQARINARNQLRQAQLNYEQQIRVIRGQIAALDNPRLEALAQKQADAYWNLQYERQIANATTPEQREKVKARVDAQREQALATAELKEEQRRIKLEEQMVKADLAFENKKIEIQERFNATKERLRDQRNLRRTQRLPTYIPR